MSREGRKEHLEDAIMPVPFLKTMAKREPSYTTSLLRDSTIRRSLEEYIKKRIHAIPDEVKHTFPGVAKIWKCDAELDFLYGYYVGRIEEGALHYLLKATRASVGGYVDTFEIRGVIEMHRKKIRDALKAATVPASGDQ